MIALQHLLHMLIVVNVILAVFNLIPIPPLDGFSGSNPFTLAVR